ncbi:MAG: hypothetical protein E7652_03980 [Ruminococcaceae bacterium]|nr:hypothetical protein [Oscillospiraceae bacterium]
MEKFKKWFENFWYHYKWPVIIGAFFVICGSVMAIQFIQREEYDSLILYTGPDMPTANEQRDIESAFEQLMTEDFNGDGDYNAVLDPLFLMTDEQLESEEYSLDENGNPILINTSEMVKTKERYTTQIFTGEALICLLDPAWYDEAYKQQAFVPLKEIIGKTPEGAYNDSALYLHETDFGKYFSCFDSLPEDTLICFRKMSSASFLKNKKREQKKYDYNKELFIDILEFEIPEK